MYGTGRKTGLILAMALAGCMAGEDSIDDVSPSEDSNTGESEMVDQLGAAPGLGVPRSLGLDPHTFYLTFDDGPSSYTRRILGVLQAHHVTGLFFVLGNRIPNNEALLRQMDEDGHLLGNHQWSHVIATTAQFQTWVPRERDTLDRTIGHRVARFFRYPYGAGSTAKETLVRSYGYPDGGIGWNLDTLDWCFGSGGGTCSRVPSTWRSNYEGWVLHEAARLGGGVMLFHDIQRITADHLDSILTRMEQAGYHFGSFPTTDR